MGSRGGARYRIADGRLLRDHPAGALSLCPRVRISDDKLPGAVRLPPKNLDRPGAKLDYLARCIGCGDIKVRIKQSQVVDSNDLEHLTFKFRLRLNKSGNYLANATAADDRFPRRSDEASGPLVQRHDGIEITGIQMLLKDIWPIFGIARQHDGDC